ncbi:hypothetical protein [Clostridium estertheticum]|nr:hypothetical protein [Clostridium estertheticum]
MKAFLWYILHTFTGCKEEDLDRMNHGSRSSCRKCNRKYFRYFN